MVDQSETRPLEHWSNPYLQPLVNSPFAQSPLRPGTSTNPPIQRQVQRITTHDISSRTINLDRNHHLNRTRPLRITSERSPTRNYEYVQVHSAIRMPEQSASTILPRVEINDERSTLITSRMDQQDAPVESSNAPIQERLACEIQMSYASPTTVPAEKSNREEIMVMQRYSTGETSLVYRGYLTKGDTFSFKSQRRPTSSLSLAFYVEGLLNSETKECCEFKCTLNAPDQKPFIFKEIHKVNPCEKCRKDHADTLLLTNDKNTLLVHRNKNSSQYHDQSNNSVTSSSSSTMKDLSSKDQQQKKTAKYKKPKTTEVSYAHQPVTSTGNVDLPAPVKSSESTTTQPSVIPAKETASVPTMESTEQKTDDNSSDSNAAETLATLGSGIDYQQLMQLLQGVRIPTQQQQQSSAMKRHPKSVENFCYILENHLPISHDEQQTLRGLINLGFTFDDINSKESLEFLKKILTERIILILSKTSMENLSKPVRDEPLLYAIYVIDSSEKKSFDSKFYRGSFPNITRCCQQLENDLHLFTYDLTTICSIPTNHTAMSTLNYVQVLKDILLEADEKRDLKKEMLDFCREEYADNVIQLKWIDEFDKQFQPENAIDWYVRHEAFVYKMMTRAFRVLDPDILFKLRYFIQHLHGQLNSSSPTSALTVYRTIRIRKDLFDKMKSYQGGWLSFNEFLLVNKNQSTIEPSSFNTDSKLVRFEIVLGTGVSRRDVPTKPNEILLTVGTMFRIDKLEPIDETTFAAQLTTNDEILKEGQQVTKSLRDAVRAPLPLVRMVKLMKHRELTGYIEYFCSMLIDDPQAVKDDTANLTLGGLLHSLGSYCYEKKQYEQALRHLQNCLKVYLRVLPDNDEKLTPTYNNIGSIYHKQGLNEQALEYHRKAYEIQKNLKDPDMDSIAAYVGNIASVLMKLDRHAEAIGYFKLDLQIKQKLHPNNDHADVATRHHNLAGAQYRAHQYLEAVESYQKCLDIELKCHSAKNPTVAVTYYNMATALQELGQLQEAKDAVEKAIARLLLTKPEDDEDVQMQRKYLQRLEQKLWMKNLFAST